MRIISRYLLLEFLGASGVVFLALFLTWIAADSLLHIDLLSSGPSWAFRQILFRAMETVPLSVPISCLAGVVWSLSRAVRYREITAIRCGGIRLRSVLVPILVLSFLLGGALILFEDRVVVPTRRALLEAERDKDGHAERRPRYLNGRWWYASGLSIFSAAEYLPEERTLQDVTVFKFDRQRHIQQRIDADRALNLEGSSWEFHGVRVLEFKAASRGLEGKELPVLSVDLGLSGQDLVRAGPPLALTTLHRLARRIRRHVGSDATLTALQVGFHGRLAQPLAVLVLVLLAVPFAIGDVEYGDSLPRALLRSLAAAGIYWIAWSLALVAGRSSYVPPPFPVWGVTLLCLGIGAWRFRRINE